MGSDHQNASRDTRVAVNGHEQVEFGEQRTQLRYDAIGTADCALAAVISPGTYFGTSLGLIIVAIASFPTFLRPAPAPESSSLLFF